MPAQRTVQGDTITNQGRLLGDEVARQALSGAQLGQHGQVVIEPFAVALTA